MRKSLCIALFFLMGLNQLSAQTVQQNTGWFALFNTTKFNSKWGLALDIQVRSADDWAYVRNTLFRPGLTYYINDRNNVTAGYALITTAFHTPVVPNYTLLEHRIWEQYILTHKISSVFAMHRFRLEQRFIENKGPDDTFSQRFRYFFRFIQPLQKQEGGFSKGAFVALQNEVFFNLQNKDKLNGSFFDQNRAYLAAGYRFSKKFDVEAGYLNQVQKGVSANVMNNVVQLALYTRF